MLLRFGQESMKNTVGQSAKWNSFFSIFRIDILDRKNIFFSVYNEGKSVIVSVQPIYSLCNKTEEHLWRILGNSNQIVFVLLYDTIGFFVC